MFFEILKIAFISMIVIPFCIMFYEVTVDILQRFLGFFRAKAKPALISVMTTITRP
jgi:hypothetical protein